MLICTGRFGKKLQCTPESGTDTHSHDEVAGQGGCEFHLSSPCRMQLLWVQSSYKQHLEVLPSRILESATMTLATYR